jgi:hypothetical protein
MRRLLLIAFLMGSVCAVMAQTKIDTKWNCLKPSAEPKLEVGDVPDHSYMIAQGTCNATSSDKAFPEKSGQYTEFRDVTKTSVHAHGRYNVTMDNGDKVYYSYEGSSPTDVTKPASNKWTIVRGTGKYKGVKGSGTCSGQNKADETSDWECTGTTSIGKGAATPK